MHRNGHVFTIYDAMEARGEFACNPANAGSRAADGTQLYQGPVKYPRMLYHPMGETFVTDPGEEVMTVFGPKLLNRHVEIINRIVGSAEEEAKWLAEGWHTHPSDAMRARGDKDVPSVGPEQEISTLNDRIAELQAQLRAAQAEATPTAKPRLNLSRPAEG